MANWFVSAVAAGSLVLVPVAAHAQTSTLSKAQPTMKCQGQDGCVLPLPAEVAPAPAAEPVVAAEPAAPVAEAQGFPILPVLLGVAALGALIALLAGGEDDDVPPPVSA